MTVRIVIDPVVAQRWPQVVVRGFHASGLDRASIDVPPISEVISELTAAGVADAHALATHELVAPWRDAVSACGLKASRYKSSAEALARRFLKNDRVTTGVPAVDLYCAVSAKNLAPLGAYDVERLPATRIDLRHARPGDEFAPLGGDTAAMPLSQAVVVYAAANTVLCWSFNHRDSSSTCLRPTTTRAVFVGEAVTTAQVDQLNVAIEELKRSLELGGVDIGADVTVEYPGA